jgi:predicted ATP-dependent serine protease
MTNQSTSDQQQTYRGAHVPRTLAQVINEANEQIMQGDLSSYIPIPTGFDPLDSAIGGGLQRGELILLGGAQGIGKTITALQMARNLVKSSNMYSFYLSYEHPEAHLMNRLLCLESVSPPQMETSAGLRMKDLQDIIVSKRAKKVFGHDGVTGSLRGILREHERTAPALANIVAMSSSSSITCRKSLFTRSALRTKMIGLRSLSKA